LNKPLHKQPGGAVLLAVGVGLASHAANTNAARVLRMDPRVVAFLVSLSILAMGLLAHQARG